MYSDKYVFCRKAALDRKVLLERRERWEDCLGHFYKGSSKGLGKEIRARLTLLNSAVN